MEIIQDIPKEERVYKADSFNYWHQHRNGGRGATVSMSGKSWTHPIRDAIVNDKYALGSTPGLEFPYNAADGSPGVMITNFKDGSRLEFSDLGTERFEHLILSDNTVITLHHLIRVFAEESSPAGV